MTATGSTGSTNLDRLAKLLRLTTSPNDHEALMAIRAANRLLDSSAWDWDRLLAGKIRIVADPFSGPSPVAPPPRAQAAPPPPPHPPTHRAPPPPPPPPPPRPPHPNSYKGPCH